MIGKLERRDTTVAAAISNCSRVNALSSRQI
jgi:hypothetical protein